MEQGKGAKQIEGSSAVLPKAPRWKVRYSILILLWACSLLSLFDRMVINVSLPLIGKEFGINEAAQGFLISLSFLSSSLFQIPGGLITDRIGNRKAVTFSIGWASLFTPLTGLAFSYPMLLIVRCLLGAGSALAAGAYMRIMVTFFPLKERATAKAISASVNSLAPAVATIVAATIIGVYGWRVVFIMLGIPGILIVSYLWFRFKDNPAEYPKITPKELAELRSSAEWEERMVAADSQITYGEFLRKPILWQLVLVWFFFDFTYWGFTTWLPSYLMTVKGFSLAKTGVYGALPYLIGTISMIYGGYLSDRLIGRRKWLFVPGALLAALALSLMIYAPSDTMTILYQCIAAAALFMAFGSFGGMQFDGLPKHIIASASATVNTAGQLAGLFSPFLLGYLIEVNGGSYTTAFLVMILSLILASGVALTIQCKEWGRKNE